MSLLPKSSTARPQLWKKGQSGNPKGRGKGVKDKVNRLSAQERVIAAQLEDKNLTPLQFMLDVLRRPEDYPFAARQWAAKEAAPYVHRKMPIAVEGGDKPLAFIDVAKLASLPTEELEKLEALLVTLGVVATDDADQNE